MERRVAIVTGATGAIGAAIAAGLASRDHDLVLVCRSAERGEAAAGSIRATVRDARVRVEVADLSRRISITELAARWTGPLHLLVNNAAVAPRRRTETPEGIEVQLATNVLGYFWMMQAFADVLARSAPARVVNVASYWAGDLDLDDLEFRRRRYDNGTAYRQAKQADRMLSAAFARRSVASAVTVTSCHPGDVSSTLSNALGFGGHESPEQAAETPIWAATAPELQGVSGRYLVDQSIASCPFAADVDAVEALYAACERY